MKKLILLLAVAMLMPAMGVAQKNKKDTRTVNPFIEGKQKVRMADYDSIWKFTTFDQKKVYFSSFDYTTFPEVLDHRKPEWGKLTPVMNFLASSSRTPVRMCVIFAINPNVDNEQLRAQLVEQGRTEALEMATTFKNWCAEQEMKNKIQVEVAQIDYRYWQGTSYFTTEQPSDALLHVGMLLYFGTKKLNLFPSAAEGARSFNNVKFFPNDATVVESYGL